MSAFEDEIRDKMLALEEQNLEDSEEYYQLKSALEGKVEKPRYPVTEHLVTIYADSLSYADVIAELRRLEIEIIETRKSVCSSWIMVRGIPNNLVSIKGVQTIGWRTQEEHDRLLASFENS